MALSLQAQIATNTVIEFVGLIESEYEDEMAESMETEPDTAPAKAMKLAREAAAMLDEAGDLLLSVENQT